MTSMDIATTAPQAASDAAAEGNRLKPSTSDADSPLQPGTRGTWQCWCRGQVLVMLGHYGWIMALDDIDHPDVGKNGGRIYIHKRDIVGGKSLIEGDIVGFYLYADHQGLGAEACTLEQAADSTFTSDAPEFLPTSSTFTADAPEFLPASKLHSANLNLMPVAVAMLVPMGGLKSSSLYPDSSAERTFNPSAPEFVPGTSPLALGMNACATEFVPLGSSLNPHANITAINLAYLSDDSSDEDSNCGDERSASLECDSEFGWKGMNHDVAPGNAVPCPPLKSASQRSDSPDASTSAGESSDAETQSGPEGMTILPPPGLNLPSACESSEGETETGAERLSKPAGMTFRPPPGLSLPLPPWRRAKNGGSCSEAFAAAPPRSSLKPQLPHPWRRIPAAMA